jgi:4a-hydroxytetrahydrobiopterin dehydratase
MCDNELVMTSCTTPLKGTPPLDDHDIGHLLSHVDQWRVVSGSLAKAFEFGDHYQTMAFVNAVAWISHREDHHPELVVGYNTCEVRYSTHSVGGLSRNDFICAAKVDALVEE